MYPLHLLYTVPVQDKEEGVRTAVQEEEGRVQEPVRGLYSVDYSCTDVPCQHKPCTVKI